MAEDKPKPGLSPASKNKAAVAMASAKNMRAVEKKLLKGYWDTEIPLDKKRVKDEIHGDYEGSIG